MYIRTYVCLSVQQVSRACQIDLTRQNRKLLQSGGSRCIHVVSFYCAGQTCPPCMYATEHECLPNNPAAVLLLPILPMRCERVSCGGRLKNKRPISTCQLACESDEKTKQKLARKCCANTEYKEITATAVYGRHFIVVVVLREPRHRDNAGVSIIPTFQRSQDATVHKHKRQAVTVAVMCVLRPFVGCLRATVQRKLKCTTIMGSPSSPNTLV